MRISDWSSDVCSSDLRLDAGELRRHFIRRCQSTRPIDDRSTCTLPGCLRYLVLKLTAEIVGVGQCIVTCSCFQAVHDAPEPSHEIDNADVRDRKRTRLNSSH